MGKNPEEPAGRPAPLLRIAALAPPQQPFFQDGRRCMGRDKPAHWLLSFRPISDPVATQLSQTQRPVCSLA